MIDSGVAHSFCMRIQEMRSGLSHLKKKAEPELPQEIFEILAIPPPEVLFEPAVRTYASELDEPRWSVVSFDQIEAGGLTYRQAYELISLLDSHGLSGLCVVTDEAAARMVS